ncbi:MAG: ROK family protein [Candidatus Acidiferrum sp.]
MAKKYVVAVDLGGTKLAAALVNGKGQVSKQMTLVVDTRSSLAPVNQIVEVARELIRARGGKKYISGIGVAVPGLVRRDGTVWAPNLKGWRRMALAQRLKRALGLPVMVESDRNAAVLGEMWCGAARGKNDAIVLMLGTGIGAGILSGGNLVRGAHELSGCAGWMVVTETNGRTAQNVGQLESLAAGPAIARAAGALNAEDVAEAARRGDRASINIYVEAGRMLGYGVANLVSLFDPEIVVIGGGLAKASDLFLDALRKGVKERAQPIAASRVRIVTSPLGSHANLLGVARLAGPMGQIGRRGRG